jgi:hypothetical protein
METILAEFENPFQQEGEVCWSCEPFWEEEKLGPKRMVAVRNAKGDIITTRNHNIEIVVCPHCDGDLILKLAQHETDSSADSSVS